MASNYEAIRTDNIRRHGEDTDLLSLLMGLYADRTHFIFELMQNAEDAKASKVRFDLFDDRLEVRHDGRLFNERDVIGICGVVRGTKAEDLTQIGKFGIGFKSVYAYTTAPEVHSGDEHFRIENFVRPFPALSRETGDLWTTLFVFPFDNPELEPGVCHDEIAARLRNLSTRTLLFLRSLEEIEYFKDGSLGGKYLREVKDRGPARQVTVIGQNHDHEEYETWLVFGRPVAVPERNDFVSVEIAFRIEQSEGEPAERIVRVDDDSPLVVYFPTEKPTRFGFLVQGPYQTTPSRDNVPRDSSWNTKLIKETAVLITDVLAHLKEMGLLTVGALLTLPIRLGDFPKDGMFLPIANAVRTTLKNQEILPADDGTYVTARRARLARGGDLRRLLPNDLLTSLLKAQESLKWLSGEITHDRMQTRDLHGYLLSELGVNEIGPDSFASNLSEDFLTNQDDDWFVKFYEFLSTVPNLWKKKPTGQTRAVLRSKPIIRCEGDTLVAPFDSTDKPAAYLPVDSLGGFRFVKRSVVRHEQALEFLKELGLTEPDETANAIENILPKYRSSTWDKISEAEYLADLRAVIGGLSTASQQNRKQLTAAAQVTPFIKARNAHSGETTLVVPSKTWLPTREIKMFTRGNPNVWLVDQLIADEFRKGLVELGARDTVNLQFKQPGWDGHVRVANDWGWHKRGLDGFDPDTEVEELEYALTHPDLERSLFVWNKVLLPNVRLLSGRVETATRQDYSNGEVSREDSKVGRQLRTHAWVPTRDLHWKVPQEVEREELHPELRLDEQLLDALGIKANKADSTHQTPPDHEFHAQSLGIEVADLEHIRFIKQHPDEFAKFRTRLETKTATNSHRAKPAFPVGESHDPKRREQRLIGQLDAAANKQYETRERSIRTSRPTIEPSVWLRSQYTNYDHQLVCQICKDVMPFKKRDGDYYFEAVETLNGDHLSKEHEAQFLALCPVCAAMYTEFVKRDPDAMSQVANSLLASQEPEIPLQLGDLKTSIRFVDIHFRDLKTILTMNSGSTTGQVLADQTARWES